MFDTKPTPFAVRELLPGTDLAATARPALGVALSRWASDGRVFSFEGPEGYTLTAHGG